NSVVPVVSGQSLQGQTVSVSTGTWSPTPTGFAYQWQRSTDGGTTWSNISAATTSSYTVAAGDLGAQIRAAVTANNSYGSATVQTAPVTVGSGAPDSYQWQTSTDNGTTWTNLAGATTSTYTLTSSDLGNLVRVSVTAVNG